MNASLFKIVFSKRLGMLVAVGEHASSQGKARGNSGQPGAGTSQGAGTFFLGVLGLCFGLTSMAWAQGVASTALPMGGAVSAGSAAISSAGAAMTIQQSSQRAAINWQSFNIGKDASVTVQQPSSSSVLLNRIGGDSPSQILGRMSANGQIVLVNPNGMTFGKDGSVSAAGFTASTLGISDADFMAGNMKFSRDGATGSIVNQGSIQTNGGYVALLGASVSNEGKIETAGGNAYLAAAEAVRVPVSGTGRIKLELSPASINAAVANSKEGAIVTQGGQVYMQAAALHTAMASVLQSGSIDTAGAQGGNVTLLAEGGHIQVDGRITANSSQPDQVGGRIVIGRDEDTGALAKSTDVSGATLESQGGFIETSGHQLKVDNTRVFAGNWLLDPDNIQITNDAVLATNYTSRVSATALSTALSAGTNVTINTTTGLSTSPSNPTGLSQSGQGSGGATATGNIYINTAVSKTGNSDATLTLVADNGIIMNSAIGVSSGSGKLNLDFTAKGTPAGVVPTAVNSNSLGIVIGGVGTMSLNGGDLKLTGTSYANNGWGVGFQPAALSSTASPTAGATLAISASNISINGTANTFSGSVGYGAYMTRFPNQVQLTATGNVNITGTVVGQGTGSGFNSSFSGVNNLANSITAGGTLTLRGNNRAATSNTMAAVYADGGLQLRSVGNLVVQAETNNASANAMNFSSNASDTLRANASFMSVDGSGNASGNVLIQSNKGGINFANNLADATSAKGIKGVNITIDNTGAGMAVGAGTAVTGSGGTQGATLGTGSINASTGAITAGPNLSGTQGINLTDNRAVNASGNLNIYGATSASNWALRLGAQITAANFSLHGNSNNPNAGTSGGGTSILNGTTIAGTASSGTNLIAGTWASQFGGTYGLLIGDSGSSNIFMSSTSGSTLNLQGTNNMVGVLAGNAYYSPGIHTQGTLTTSGTVNMTGYSQVFDGIRITGTYNHSGGVLSLDGTSQPFSGYGGSSAGVQLAGTLKVTDGSNLSVTGTNKTTNGANQSAATAYAMSAWVGSQLIGNGGTLSITGKTPMNAGLTASNLPKTMAIYAGGSISGWGATTLLGQNTSNSSLPAVQIYGPINVGSNSLNVLANGGQILQEANSTWTAGRITVDNTGAGRSSLFLDYTATPNIANGQSFGGSVGSDGSISMGTAASNQKSATTALDLNGAMTASGNINLAANTAINLNSTLSSTAAGVINAQAKTDITLAKSISTTSTASNAVTLNAGVLAAAGTSSGGNISVSGTPTITTGTGGRGTVYTGSVSGSTGLTALVGSGSGRFRYNSDEAATNYTAALGSGIYAIYREAPSITVQGNLTKTYDGQYVTSDILKSSGAVSVTAGVLANGDTLSAANANGVFLFDGASQQKNYQSSGYAITGSQAGTLSALGYSVTYATGGNLSIAQRAVTLSANTQSKTYDGTTGVSNTGAYSVSATDANTGFVSGEGVTGVSLTYTDKNAGTSKTITISNALANSSTDLNNYAVSYISNTTSTINKADLTVTASQVTKTYDGTTAATGSGTVGTLAGASAGDVVNSAGSQVFTDKNAGTGNKTVIASGVTIKDGSGADMTGNYNIAYVSNTSSTINKADLTVTASQVTKTYDGTTAATGSGTVGTLAGASAGDVVNSAGSQVFTDKNAGTGNKTVIASGVTIKDGSGADMTGNYNIAYVSNTSSTITPKAISVSGITASDKVYDGNTSATVSTAGASFNGMVSGDNLTVSSSGTFSDKNVGSAKSVALSSSYGGSDVANYTFTDQASTTATITPKALTASLTGHISKTYDSTTNATLNAANFSVNGFVMGEGASVNQTAGSYTSANVDVNSGSAMVSASLLANHFTTNNGTLLSNYVLPTSASGNVGTITPAALVIKVNDATAFVTQDANSALNNGYSYSGLQGTDNASTALVRSPVASDRTYNGTTYPVAGTYSGVYGLGYTPVAQHGNYTISVQSGKLTVIPADQLLIHVASQSEAYGNRTASTAGKAAVVSAQYCLDASNCNGANIYTLSMTSSDGTVWRGTDNTNTTISFNTTLDSAGHLSSGGFLNAGNYGWGVASLSSTTPGQFNGYTVDSGALTIDRLLLTPSANAVSKVYDGTASAAGVTLNSTQALVGDDLRALAGGGSYSTKNVITNDTVTFTNLTLQGADKENYALAVSNVQGMGSITPKAISVSGITASDKVYDGNTSATVSTAGASFNGMVSGDNLTVSSSGTFSDKNVGSAKSVALSSSYGGSDVANYTFTDQASTTAAITPKAISVSGITASDKVYDGNTSATVSTAGASFNGMVSGDNLTVSSSGTFSDKNVGSAKFVALSSSYGGSDVANYTFTDQASTTAAVTPKEVTLQATKVYDATKTLTGDQLTISTGVANETLNYSAASLASKDVADKATNHVASVTLTDGSGLASNYTFNSAKGASNQALITPAPLTIAATATQTVYNGKLQQQTLPTVRGLLGNDVLTVSGLATGIDPGSYMSSLRWSGLGADNYSVTALNAPLVILNAPALLPSFNRESVKKIDPITRITLLGFRSASTAGATAALQKLQLATSAQADSCSATSLERCDCQSEDTAQEPLFCENIQP